MGGLPIYVSIVIRIGDITDAVEAGLRAHLAQLELEQAVYGIDVLDELALHPILEQGFHAAGFGVYREQRYPADRIRRRVSEGERYAVSLAEAFWLEVKVVSQFTIEGPNASYSSQLLATVRQDVTKLSKDPGILQAGLLLIMFVRDRMIADHDLNIWQNRCLERGLPIGAPSRRYIDMTDRHGHALCAIAAYPVSHL
jgi:hypothetical protein